MLISCSFTTFIYFCIIYHLSFLLINHQISICLSINLNFLFPIVSTHQDFCKQFPRKKYVHPLPNFSKYFLSHPPGLVILNKVKQFYYASLRIYDNHKWLRIQTHSKEFPPLFQYNPLIPF